MRRRHRRHNKNKNDRIKFVSEPNNGGRVNKTVGKENKYIRTVSAAYAALCANNKLEENKQKLNIFIFRASGIFYVCCSVRRVSADTFNGNDTKYELNPIFAAQLFGKKLMNWK